MRGTSALIDRPHTCISEVHQGKELQCTAQAPAAPSRRQFPRHNLPPAACRSRLRGHQVCILKAHDVKFNDRHKVRCKPVDEDESVGRLPQHQPHAAEQALALIRVSLSLRRRPNNIDAFFHILHFAHLPVIQALDEQAACVVDRGGRLGLLPQAVRLAYGGLHRPAFTRGRVRGKAARTCICDACFFMSSAEPITGDAVSSKALIEPPSSRLFTTTFCISCSMNSCSARLAACSAAKRTRASASSRVMRPLNKAQTSAEEQCGMQAERGLLHLSSSSTSFFFSASPVSFMSARAWDLSATSAPWKTSCEQNRGTRRVYI